MGQALYRLINFADEYMLHHRFNWLCSLLDFYGPYSKRQPSSLVLSLALLAVFLLLCVTTGKEYAE